MPLNPFTSRVESTSLKRLISKYSDFIGGRRKYILFLRRRRMLCNEKARNW
jgi:hypothetical protein